MYGHSVDKSIGFSVFLFDDYDCGWGIYLKHNFKILLLQHKKTMVLVDSHNNNSQHPLHMINVCCGNLIIKCIFNKKNNQ